MERVLPPGCTDGVGQHWELIRRLDWGRGPSQLPRSWQDLFSCYRTGAPFGLAAGWKPLSASSHVAPSEVGATKGLGRGGVWPGVTVREESEWLRRSLVFVIHFSRLVFIIHFSRASPGITRMQIHAQTHTHKKKQELFLLPCTSGHHLHMANARQIPIEGGKGRSHPRCCYCWAEFPPPFSKTIRG